MLLYPISPSDVDYLDGYNTESLTSHFAIAPREKASKIIGISFYQLDIFSVF